MLIAGAALWALEFKLAAMLRKTTPVLTLSCVPKCKENFKVLFFLFFLSNVEAGQRLSCETCSGMNVLAEIHSLAPGDVSKGFSTAFHVFPSAAGSACSSSETFANTAQWLGSSHPKPSE